MEGADVVVLSLGLGNDIEGEGRDRSALIFPPPQAALLDAVKKAVKAQNAQTGAKNAFFVAPFYS